jgi:5'-nucleotidase
MRVLLTNDDGIHAEGLQTLRRALQAIPGVDLRTIAPDSNRSATARSITIRRPIWVEEVDFGDGTIGYATDGTPVDCVRFAALGLIDGWEAQLIVSGINHGSNLGDDITYSGTVAAALEGLMLGLPAIAVSQQSNAGEMDFRAGDAFDFAIAADFSAALVTKLDDVPLPEGTLLNVNVPRPPVAGVEVVQLGRRVYLDELEVLQTSGRRRQFSIYGAGAEESGAPDTDLAAVGNGHIAVTPLHFDLTARPDIDGLREFDLAQLLKHEVTE